MQQGRRWMGIALSAAAAVALCLGSVSLAAAGEAGPPEALDWRVNGSIEAGGIYSGFGERGAAQRGSAKFDQYRDMHNGFIGEEYIEGEHTKKPYFFEFYGKNPGRDDQKYEGAFGRYGLFEVNADWARIPHVLFNNAQTIFSRNGSDFTLGAARGPVATTFDAVTNPATNAQRLAVQSTINGLLRPVDLRFNTDVADASAKFTPTEALRFDISYMNRRVEGTRALSAPIDSAVRFGAHSNTLAELAVPLDQMTHEAKFRGEYATQAFAVQTGYTASIFENNFQAYTWDNPVETAGPLARGAVAANPNNIAHTWDLTARSSLPFWRTAVSGAFSYTMQRQNQTFITPSGAPTNAAVSGETSPDAQANLLMGNFRVSSRPFSNVTATAFYRYFERQNDSKPLTFNSFPHNLFNSTESTAAARFAKQNAGMDIGWRPVQMLSLKGGYQYEHWNRADYQDQTFSTSEHIAKASADITPTDWLLARLTYLYGNRNLYNYGLPTTTGDPNATTAASGPGFFMFNFADRVRNRADALFQFSPWETVTPTLTFGYSDDHYPNSAYGLSKDKDLSAGVGLTWAPIPLLTVTGNYSYEYHFSRLNVFRSATTPWQDNGRDQFHIFNLATVLDLIPKQFTVTLDYGITFGYSDNEGIPLHAGSVVTNLPRVDNVLQTLRLVAKYRLTQKLSVRAGLAYERYTERNWYLDPMQPFMGFFDTSAAGAASVFLGAHTDRYESYTFGTVVHYDF